MVGESGSAFGASWRMYSGLSHFAASASSSTMTDPPSCFIISSWRRVYSSALDKRVSILSANSLTSASCRWRWSSPSLTSRLTLSATSRVTLSPGLLEDTDCRRWSSDCTCSVCQHKFLDGSRQVKSPFDDYNNIVPGERESLTRHMYLLCPYNMHGFVFKMRTWRKSKRSQGHSVAGGNQADNCVFQTSCM